MSEFERAVSFVHGGCRGEVSLDLIEHRPEQVFLVGEVVVEGTTGADVGLGDDLLRPGCEVALGDEQFPCCGDQCRFGGFASRQLFRILSVGP